MTTTAEAHARPTDPETSQEAAASVRDISLVQSRIVLLLRRYGPMTDELLIKKYREWFGDGPTDQSIRSRRAELVKAKKVIFSGIWGLTKTGHRSREWMLKPEITDPNVAVWLDGYKKVAGS